MAKRVAFKMLALVIVTLVFFPHYFALAEPNKAQAGFIGSISLRLSGPLALQGVFIYGQSEPMAIIEIFNSGEKEELKLSFEVYDHNSQPVIEMEFPFNAEVGASQIEIPLDLLPIGWYKINYRVYSSHALLYTLGGGVKDFVILPEVLSTEQAYPYSPFGVENTKLTKYDAEIIKYIGASWLKGPFVPTWSDTQFSPGGSLIWRSRLDEAGLARGLGLKQQAVIGEPPIWAKGQSSVSFLREHLGDYVKYLQGLNDQDLIADAVSVRGPVQIDVPNQDEVINDFVLQLRLTKLILTEARKSTTINLELAGFDFDLISALLKRGVAEYIDALLIHLDQDVDLEEIDWEGNLLKLEELWRPYGPVVPVWTVALNKEGYQQELALESSPLGPSEEEIAQAKYLVKSHLIQLANGVERIFASPFSTDQGARRLFTGGAGAYPDTSQRPRLALMAYAAMIDQIRGYTYLGRLQLSDYDQALVFINDGEAVLVAWSDQPHTNLELSVGSKEIQILNMVGQPEKLNINRDILRVSLSDSPIYIKGLDKELVSRVVIDEYIPRLEEWAKTYPVISQELNLFSHLLNQFITDLWLMAALEGDTLKGVSSSFLSWWFVDNPIDEESRKEQALFYWTQCVETIIDTLYILSSEPDFYKGPDTVLLYKLLDQLTILCELAAFIDTPWGQEDYQLYVTATHELLVVAMETLRQMQVDEGGISFNLALGLLEKCSAWQEKGNMASPSLASALAVVIREVATFSVLQSAKEPGYDYTLALQSPSLYLSKSKGDYKPASLDPVDPKLWADSRPSPTRLLRENPRPTIRVGEEEIPPYNIGTTQNWDELPIALELYNFGGEKEVYLTLQAPLGWLWQVDGHIFDHNAVLVDWPIQLIASDSFSPYELIIDLIIPKDAKEGEYEVQVGLVTPVAKGDLLQFVIEL